jgi:Flp pilus assembly protein TadD
MPTPLRFFAVLAAAFALLAGCQPKTPPPAPAPPSAAERLATAKTALAAGDAGRAQSELAEAVRLDPNLAEAQVYLGIFAYKNNDPQRGEAALRRAMAAAPDSPLAYEALGIAEYGRDRRPEARAALETAEAKGSADPRTYYYLGNLALLAGDCRAGLTAYRRAMALDPSFTPARTEYEAAWGYCAGQGQTPGSPSTP